MASATRCRDVVGAWQWAWLAHCTECAGRCGTGGTSCGEGCGSGCGYSVAAGVLGGVVLVVSRGLVVGVAVGVARGAQTQPTPSLPIYLGGNEPIKLRGCRPPSDL